MQNQNRIGAVSTFITEIAKIVPKKGHSLFFRGQSSEKFNPIPHLFRNIAPEDEGSPLFSQRENVIFEQMVASCPNDFLNCHYTFDYLVKMQHYGLPTRLLDITTNPLVALYFACSSYSSSIKQSADGEVIIYEIKDEDIKYNASDTVSILSNLAKMDNNFNYPSVVKNERSLEEQVSVDKFLRFINTEKQYFTDAIIPEDLTSIQAVKPKLDNPRIIRKSGAFLLFGMHNKKFEPSRNIRKLYKEIDSNYFIKTDDRGHVLKIKSKSKKNIIKSLDGLGISKATLFPEIDNVSQHIKEQTIDFLKTES